MKVCERCKKKFLFSSQDPALCPKCYDAVETLRRQVEQEEKERQIAEAQKVFAELGDFYQWIRSMEIGSNWAVNKRNQSVCEQFEKKFNEFINLPYVAEVTKVERDYYIPDRVHVGKFGYLPYVDLGCGMAEVKFDEILAEVSRKKEMFRNFSANEKHIITAPDTYVVLDVETTGLNHNVDRIIEIAAVKYENDIEADSFVTLVNPSRLIPEEITSLTGIANSDLREAPHIDEVIPKLADFIGCFPIVAHNAAFDMSFLADAYRDMGLPFPNESIDTLKLAKQAFPDLGTYKLSNLKKVLELKSKPAHRALPDVYTTAELFVLCKKRISEDSYQPEYIEHDFGSHRTKFPKNPCPSEIQPTCPVDQIDPDGPLYKKNIVFTGTLSVSRQDAMQIAVNAGALIKTAVSGKTHYLVVGEQDVAIVGDDGMSKKEEKANALNAAGKADIKFINEVEFLRLAQVEVQANG